jgi:hypothetical protein
VVKRTTRSFVAGGRIIWDAPTLADLDETKAIGRWASQLLEPFQSECAHGWRKGRGVPTALERIREIGGPRVCGLDVVSFFPSIHQKRLKRMLLALPYQIGWRIWDCIEPWLPKLGLPEGCGFSPALANFYLTGRTVDARWAHALTRYGDDFVMGCFEPERELALLAGRLTSIGLASHRYEIDRVRFCGHLITKDQEGGGLHITPIAKKRINRRRCDSRLTPTE